MRRGWRGRELWRDGVVAAASAIPEFTGVACSGSGVLAIFRAFFGGALALAASFPVCLRCFAGVSTSAAALLSDVS